jgi:hypothetical protein
LNVVPHCQHPQVLGGAAYPQPRGGVRFHDATDIEDKLGKGRGCRITDCFPCSDDKRFGGRVVIGVVCFLDVCAFLGSFFANHRAVEDWRTEGGERKKKIVDPFFRRFGLAIPSARCS